MSDIEGIHIVKMAQELKISITDIKLALNGPRNNVDNSSIEQIKTISHAKKLFRQAQSLHRRCLIGLKWLDMCSTLGELHIISDIVPKQLSYSVYRERFSFAFSLKVHEMAIAQLTRASGFSEILGIWIFTDFLHENEEYNDRGLTAILWKALYDSAINVEQCISAFGLTQSCACGQNLFLFKAASMINGRFSGPDDVVKLLKLATSSASIDLKSQADLKQMILEKASALYRHF